MQQPHLFGLVRQEFGDLLNRYVQHPEVIERLEEYIQPPRLGGRAGVLGTLVLAEQALANSSVSSGVSRSRSEGA